MDQIIDFLEKNGGELLTKMWEHLYISLIAVVLGILVAVPLGVVLTRMKRGAGFIIGIVNIFQTLPSLAILAFLFLFWGLGKYLQSLLSFLFGFTYFKKYVCRGPRCEQKLA